MQKFFDRPSSPEELAAAESIEITAEVSLCKFKEEAQQRYVNKDKEGIFVIVQRCPQSCAKIIEKTVKNGLLLLATSNLKLF